MKLNITQLSYLLKEKCSYIAFAYLFGSAQNGIVNYGSDIDIGIYLYDLSFKEKALIDINKLLESLNVNAECDIVFVNGSNPILGFEVISGTRLFVRNDALNLYAGYYSLTCREYESDSYWMKKQLEYRNYEVQWNN